METWERKPWVSLPQALHEGPAPPQGDSVQRPPPPRHLGACGWRRPQKEPQLGEERATAKAVYCYSHLDTWINFSHQVEQQKLKIRTQSASGRDAPQVMLPSEGQAGQGQLLWRLGPGLSGHTDP